MSDRQLIPPKGFDGFLEYTDLPDDVEVSTAFIYEVTLASDKGHTDRVPVRIGFDGFVRTLEDRKIPWSSQYEVRSAERV